MNATLGTAGVVLGAASAILGVITVGLGLRRKRPALLESGWTYSLLILLGAVVAVVAMQRALITRDFSVSFVHDNGSSRTPRLFNVATMWSALEGSILLWALILAGFTVHVARKFRRRLSRPARRLGPADDVRRLLLLLPPHAVPGQPLRDGERGGGLRRAGAQPAPAEAPAHGLPPADALPRLRRLHGAVRLRRRRPRHRPARRGVAGRDPPWPRSSRGASSPSASSSAPGGATRCSAGAATGAGTRSRTRRCCRGSPAPPTCTR